MDYPTPMRLLDIQIFSKKPLSEFEKIVFDDDYYFYYDLHIDISGEGNGFEFICYRQTDLTNDDIVMVVNGLAYFDGIRHLHFGDEKSDNYGYFNYPKMPVLIQIMNKLRELELKYCRYI